MNYPLFNRHFFIEWRTFYPPAPFKALFDLRPTNIGDFAPIYEAAQNNRRLPHYRMYNPEHLAHYRPSLTAHESTFVYTPFAALLVAPLAMLDMSLNDAAFTVNVFNHVLWIGAAIMLFLILTCHQNKTFPISFLFVLQYLAFYPLSKSLQLTQATMWIFFCLVLSVFFLQRRRDVAAGLIMALSASIKPHLLLVLLPLVINRFFPRRMLTSYAVGIVLTGLASLLYAGIENCLDYVFSMLPTLSRGYAFYPNKGINGLLLRLFTTENQTICNLAQPVPWIMTVTSLFGLFLIGAAVLVCCLSTQQHKHDDNLMCFAIAVTAIVLASPVCWEHHLSVMFIPFSVVVNRLWRHPELRSRSLDGILFLSFLLVGSFFNSKNLSGFPRALFSGLEFYGALLLFGCLILLMLKQKGIHSPQAS